jgi:hypothetical protein
MSQRQAAEALSAPVVKQGGVTYFIFSRNIKYDPLFHIFAAAQPTRALKMSTAAGFAAEMWASV